MVILIAQSFLFADLAAPTPLAISIISLVHLEARLVPVRLYHKFQFLLLIWRETRTFHSKNVCPSEFLEVALAQPVAMPKSDV